MVQNLFYDLFIGCLYTIPYMYSTILGTEASKDICLHNFDKVSENKTENSSSPYPRALSYFTKVAVVRDSHKLFLSLTGEFE
jgi:hypothetical protein